jgi:hypothetical protein
MNKTKFLVFIAFAAMLAACGSDDGSPPDLANKNPESISPFDTLVVKFNSDLVDIDKLDSSNIISNQKMKWIKGKATGRELRFIGTDTTPGGWHHFKDDIKNESITFKNLKNADGYVATSLELKFSTHPIFDIEPNNSEEEAKDLSPFLTTSEKKVKFAGILDHKFETNASGEITDVKRDVADLYKLELKAADSVFITASSRTTAQFKVRFYGECHKPPLGCLNDTLTITKQASLSKAIPSGHWPDGAIVGSKTEFYIKVFDVGIASPVNPYVIEIGIKPQEL